MKLQGRRGCTQITRQKRIARVESHYSICQSQSVADLSHPFCRVAAKIVIILNCLLTVANRAAFTADFADVLDVLGGHLFGDFDAGGR